LRTENLGCVFFVATLRPVRPRGARLDPEGSSFRRPPDGWEKAIAKLARERAGELAKLAEELEST